MAYFEFRDCVDGGTNVINEWLGQQPDAVRARFYSDFQYLANTPIGEWTLPRTAMLHGEFRQLREFRVQYRRVRYRLVGFHGPNAGGITLCAGFTHSQNRAAQLEAKRRALRRKDRVERGEARRVEHVI